MCSSLERHEKFLFSLGRTVIKDHRNSVCDELMRLLELLTGAGVTQRQPHYGKAYLSVGDVS